MFYVIYMPPNTKDLTIELLMVAYGNQQNATKFARANNSDLLRALKHLMKPGCITDLFVFDLAEDVVSSRIYWFTPLWKDNF